MLIYNNHLGTLCDKRFIPAVITALARVLKDEKVTKAVPVSLFRPPYRHSSQVCHKNPVKITAILDGNSANSRLKIAPPPLPPARFTPRTPSSPSWSF